MNSISRKIDDTNFTLNLPDNDRAILRHAIELQRDSANEIANAAMRDLDESNEFFIDANFPLTQFDYSNDDDDYLPAAANICAKITDALNAQIYQNAREMIIELFNDDDFLIDMQTADFAHSFPLDIDDE